MTPLQDEAVQVTQETLKPCPFCGWIAPKTIYIRDGRVAQCPNCGMRGAPCFHGRSDQPTADERAIAAWNTRTSSSDAAIPDGWVLVPREPTEAMVIAGCGPNISLHAVYSAWASMLSAAPTPGEAS